MSSTLGLIDQATQQWWWQLAHLLILAPFLEEYVLRAGLHQALLTHVRSTYLRIILVASVFAAMHIFRGAWWLALALIPTGLAIGWLYERRRMWTHCALMHAALNLIWIALAVLAPAAHAADAWRGKTLYDTPAPSFFACSNSGCHDSNLTTGNLNKIKLGANNPAIIATAINNNTGGMGVFATVLSTVDIEDIAAYIENPTISGPSNTVIASVPPSSLAFGSTVLGNLASAQLVTLRNTANKALNITSLTSTNPKEFPAAGFGACVDGGTLASGASCSVSVSFAPVLLGARSASLIIEHDQGQFNLRLSGLGAAVPEASSVNTPVTPPVKAPASALSNVGAGGCTMSETGHDASMGLLVLAAVITGLWRRSFFRSKTLQG
jgi:cytochrome c553